MKQSIFTTLLGYSFFIILSFAVLFDPTEMALGSKIIELSPFLIATAEVLGNVIWILGVLYLIVLFGCVALLFSEDVYKEAADKAKANPEELKPFKKSWADFPKFLISFTIAVIANHCWRSTTAWAG